MTWAAIFVQRVILKEGKFLLDIFLYVSRVFYVKNHDIQSMWYLIQSCEIIFISLIFYRLINSLNLDTGVQFLGQKKKLNFVK